MALKNINYMMNLVNDFLNDRISRLDMELDFNYELTERFPKMKREHREYAEVIFDYLSVDGVDAGDSLSDAEFKKLIRRQFKEVKDIVKSGFG